MPTYTPPSAATLVVHLAELPASEPAQGFKSAVRTHQTPSRVPSPYPEARAM